ncbi:MAG: hypothetical protein ABL982_24600 [Vicinamibacterales bacterium]
MLERPNSNGTRLAGEVAQGRPYLSMPLNNTTRYLIAIAALLFAACGGTASSPTAPSSISTPSLSTSTPASVATGVASYTYTTDVLPIVTADCTRCHGPSLHEKGYDFTTYAGVLRAVTPGNSNSILVRATRSNGTMYRELSGNRAQKSQILLDWVVSSRAAQ